MGFTGDSRMGRIEKNETAPEAVHEHVGHSLKARRRALDKSLDDVANDLRIQRKYLSMLERLDLEGLPGTGYVWGYIRSYTRYLGLAPDPIIAKFKNEMSSVQKKPAPYIRTKIKRGLRLPRGSFAMSSVLGCALVVFSWYGLQPQASSAQMTSIAETPTIPISGTLPGDLPATESISIRAVGPSWLEITDKSGKIIVSRIVVPGETIETKLSQNPVLSARDGGALNLYVGGELQGPLGERGQILHKISLSATGE